MGAAPMSMHDAAGAELLRALLRDGAAATSSALAPKIAAAAATEVDRQLEEAERRAAAVDLLSTYDDRRCLVSRRWQELHARWGRRLRMTCASASEADRAMLVARQALAEAQRDSDDDRFLGPVRELTTVGSSVRDNRKGRWDLRLHMVMAAALPGAWRCLQLTDAVCVRVCVR